MDPDANYAEQMRLYGSKDRDDKEQLRELVAALREWVNNGGFKPRGWMGPKWRPAKQSPEDKRRAKLRDFSAWKSHARWLLAIEREYGSRSDDWPAWAVNHAGAVTVDRKIWGEQAVASPAYKALLKKALGK